MWKKLKLFCTVDGNVKWCSCCGKHYGYSLKKLIVELSFDRGTPFSVYTYIKSLCCILQISYNCLSIAFIKMEQQKLTTWWSSNSTAKFKSKSIYGKVSKRCCTLMFIAAFFTIDRCWKSLIMSIDEWKYKCGIHIQWNILSK